MGIKKIAIGGFVIILLALVLFVIYNFFLYRTNQDSPLPAPEVATTPSYIEIKTQLLSPQTTLEQKKVALKSLKDISLDETQSSLMRVDAGETVVSSFFHYGASIADGFSDKPFDEREVFEYAKYISTLGNSGRNSLLTAYIGLRFYSSEIDKEFVAQHLRTYNKYVQENGSIYGCPTQSKFSSILYLASKNAHTDVSSEFGDYYSSFEEIYERCQDESKMIVAFMWLAAIADIGNTEKEAAKAEELLSYIIRDTSDNSPIVQNLRYSYFVPVQEPDTVEMVNLLSSKYPKFKEFIETIK
jgi:hypothetical protein